MNAFLTASTTVAFVSFAMLAAVACGREKAEPKSQTAMTGASMGPKASCDMTAVRGTCSEYWRGSSFDLEKAMCGEAHGQFRTSGCSSAREVGACALPDGEVKHYFGSGARAFSETEARADCESETMKGRFTPPR